MKHDHTVIDLGVRAVDVGYFNVKYTRGYENTQGSNRIATSMFPALAPRMVARTSQDDPTSAAVDGCFVEMDGVRYFTGTDAIYNTAGTEPRTVAEDYCMTAKYLALLRGALHYMSADRGGASEFIISDLVLGLPLSTFDQYRTALVERATGEHQITTTAGAVKRVTVERAHVVIQPVGALLNFGAANKAKLPGWTLVLDPGGGTLDWYVVNQRKANRIRSGAYAKSMLACAYAVADALNPKWKDQLTIVERIDHAIRSRAEKLTVAGRDYALDSLTGIIDGVLEDCTGKMFEKVGDLEDIEQILLTGGGASVLHRYLLMKRPEIAARIILDEDPVFSNVRGFHIFGEYLQGQARKHLR